jgi:UPF0716 protein FxsA
MLLLALLAVPLVEVLAFVAVGLAIGWWLAVALLLGTSLLGVLVLRAEGRAALARVSLAASERSSPGPAAVNAALGLLGALLLVVPGFVTDALAVPLLLGPTRALVRRLLSRHLARRVTRFVVVARRFGPSAAPTHPAEDIEATAIEDEPRQLER